MNTIDDIFNIGTPTMKPPTPKTVPTLILTANRDQMHSQLMSLVRLNRYDMKFMINIAEKYISQGKPLSPGQNELYEKIVHKYRKQLRKLKVNYRDLLALEWKHGLVTPEVLNQQTFFRVVDDDGIPDMRLYFNFNKGLIEEVRALVHDDVGNHLNRGTGTEFGNFGNGQKYDFNWNNTTKTWHGPMNIYLFKELCKFAVKANVKFEDSVTNITNKLNESGTAKQWTPAIRIINDNIYVSHLAETMLPFIDKLDATDTSVINLERYAKLGLTAPEEFANIGAYISSANTTKHELATTADVDTLRNYVVDSKRKIIFHIPEISNSRSPRKSQTLQPVIEALRDCKNWTTSAMCLPDPDDKAMPAYGQPASSEELDNLILAGYNTLVTTTPLTSLLRSQSEIGKFALAADKVIHISIAETK